LFYQALGPIYAPLFAAEHLPTCGNLAVELRAVLQKEIFGTKLLFYESIFAKVINIVCGTIFDNIIPDFERILSEVESPIKPQVRKVF
jgi:hypothetical protein